MPARGFLFLCLIGHVFAKKPPEVDCVVVGLQYVHCSWNKNGIPEVNYTFYGWFHYEDRAECTTYLLEDNTNIGCNQPYGDINNRFNAFYTKLVSGSTDSLKDPEQHQLKSKVLLNPPTNVTVQMGSDSNLWVYWNQTLPNCVESDIQYRKDNRNFEKSKVSTGVHSFVINLPSRNSRYELQVRSKIGKRCGESSMWSEWSHPVAWGQSNDTETSQINALMPVWTPVLYVFSSLFLIILVLILLHHERLRIILIPVVPKPSLASRDIQDWFQLSKGLKESFNPNYNEPVCPVREYCDSESSDSSSSSVTTDQTDCSVFINEDSSTVSAAGSSSISTGLLSAEEAGQVSFMNEASQSEFGSS